MSDTGTHSSWLQWPLLGFALLPMMSAGLFNSAPTPAAVNGERESPSLVFDEYLANYGPQPIHAAATITVPFFYRNTSDKPITIDAIRTSCGCMKPQIDSMKIASGQSGRLVVPISTVNEQPGPHEYLVKLEYSDPEKHEVDLGIKMTLPTKAVLVQPKRMLFYQSGTQPTTQTVTITDYRPDAFQVKSIACSSELWTVKQKSHVRAIDGTTNLVLEVTMTGGIPPGTHRGVVTVTTSDPSHPYLTVQLIGQGFGKPSVPIAAVQPSARLVLKPTPKGELTASTPFNGSLASEIISVSATPEFVNATIDEDDDGNAIVRVSAMVDPADRKARVNGRVTIRTKSSEQPTTIPVVIPALRPTPR